MALSKLFSLKLDKFRNNETFLKKKVFTTRINFEHSFLICWDES